MLKATFLIIAATFVPQALAVCSTGDLAIGVTEGILFRITHSATLWSDECQLLDSKSNVTDLCGTYSEGANVTCDAGSGTPISAQLGDGVQFDDCVQDTDAETCGPAGSVMFCCIPAIPPPASQ